MDTMTKVKRLIDTSIVYDDSSKNEMYTDTGNIKTANFKAVPYTHDNNENCKKYFLVYKRHTDGLFGNYLDGTRVKHNSLKDCIKEINQYLENK